MKKFRNLRSGKTALYNDVTAAAKDLTGLRYAKTDEEMLNRLARRGWTLIADSDVVESDAVEIERIPQPVVQSTQSTQQQGNAMAEFQNFLNGLVDVDAKIKNQLDAHIGALKDEMTDIKSSAQQFMQNALETAINNLKPTTIIVKRPDATEVKFDNQHKEFGKLLKMISAGINPLMVGPAGSGKTTAAEKVAEALGRPFYSKSVGGQSTEYQFFGYMDANGKYVRTLFREAYEHGGIFLLDELDCGNANVLTSINQALANGYCAFADGMVKKHSDFVCVASANTFGSGASRDYVGRNTLDAATKDRFVPIVWDYDLDLEDSLCPDKEWLTLVRKVRENVAKYKIRQVISPRASINGYKLLQAGISLEDVKQMCLIKDMNETEIKQVMN